MEVSGRWSNRKLDLRDWASITSLLPPQASAEVGLGSALPLVSLEMIAYPAARREEAHQLHTLRTFMKRKLLFNFFLLKPTFLYPLVAFMNPRFGPVEEERDVCHFTGTVNHLSHYPDRRTAVWLNLKYSCEKSTIVFQGREVYSKIRKQLFFLEEYN